ncbi:hypothetical protein [Succinimonas amylolytica]|uniref:hypothetical protein n=1 Tax=Succinimonas amylolytica TaxID=83769 RepID=UPI00036A5FE1|nr:hypothetical protein [Succinimonas amylolytica]
MSHMNTEVQEMLFDANDRSIREMIEKDNGILTFSQTDSRYESTKRWLERNNISYVNMGTRNLFNIWVRALEVRLPLPAAA